MDVEAFIRDAAAKGWSKRRTYLALGMSCSKFKIIADAMPDVVWTARDYGAKARQIIRQRHLYTWAGRTGTVAELAPHSPVSERTIRRRLEVGIPVDQAFSLTVQQLTVPVKQRSATA